MTSQDGPTAGRAREVAVLLQRLTAATARYSDRAGAVRGLHRSDLHALQAVVAARTAGEPPLTPSRLAATLGLTPSATTALLDRLERVGHVWRDHDPVDRRRVGVHMTETAGQEARTIYGPLAARMAAVVAELDPAEVDAVVRFLQAAAEVVETQPLPDALPDAPT